MYRLLCAGLGILFCLSGCGKKEPNIYRVTGKITRNNQPVVGIVVHFFPEFGRPSWGKTNENGEFELDYDLQRKGAVEGKHRVYVEYRPGDPGEEHAVRTGAAKQTGERAAILAKYSEENSQLEVIVNKDKQEVHLQLD